MTTAAVVSHKTIVNSFTSLRESLMSPTTTKHCLYFPTTTQMSITPAFILTISTRKWLQKRQISCLLSRSPLSLANHAHSTTQPSTPSQKGVACGCIGNEPLSLRVLRIFRFVFASRRTLFYSNESCVLCMAICKSAPVSIVAGRFFVGVCEAS